MSEAFNSKSSSCIGLKDKGDMGVAEVPPLRPKKSFPVEFDPDTGDKFINLNGKKLKMVEMTDTQEPAKKLQKTIILSKPKMLTSAIKLKAPTGQPLVIVAGQPKGPANDPQKSLVIANSLREKRYIKVNRQSLSEKITDNVGGKLKACVNSTEKATDDSVSDKMKALDLSKTNNKSDNCSQTEIKEYNDIAVQAPESMSDFVREDVFFSSLIGDIDLSDILQPQPDMLENKTAVGFFQDLRAALQPDDRGNMPIHIAVIKNNLSMLKKNWFVLRTLKQSIDIPNSNGFTALQLAITTNASKQLITFLLENQARLDVHDSDGNNLLHLALEYRREDAMPTLLDHSDKFNVINEHNHEGMTPLMIGAMSGQHGCVEILLDYGAAIDLRDMISGRTALFHAAENHDLEMVKLLLHNNANTKIKNFFGTSPHDAMYEIEEISNTIKHLILGKNLAAKRKQLEEQQNPRREGFKLLKSEPRVKTYSKVAIGKADPRERTKTKRVEDDIVP